MRSMLLLAAVLAAAVLLALASPVLAGTQGTRAGTVGGLVTTAGGRPVPDAAVVLRGSTVAGLAISMHTRTDRDGRFRFSRVPAGRYVVAARHPRAGVGREAVALRPGQHVRVHIVLH